MGLQTDVTIRVDAALDTTIDLGSTCARLGIGIEERIPDGAAAGQARRVWADAASINGGSSTTLSLTTLAGAQPEAGLSAVKVFAIRCLTGEITIGGAGTTWAGATALLGDASDTIRLPAGAMLVAVAPTGSGWTVTGGAADDLLLTAGSEAATYQILVVGS